MQIEVLNKSVYTHVSVRKSGYTQVVPGQSIRYTFKEIGNNSTVSLDNFFWRDTLLTDAVRLDKIITGTWSAKLTYKAVFRTNVNGEYRTLADNLDTQRSYTRSFAQTHGCRRSCSGPQSARFGLHAPGRR